MGHLRLTIIFVYFLLFTKFTSAQQSFSYPFRHITQADGLLHNEVYSITQDKKGFIWVGTQKSLQRFDGLRFVNYPDSSDKPGENNAVLDLYTDNNSNCIWVFKDFKFKRLHLLENKFLPFNIKSISTLEGEKYSLLDSSHLVSETAFIPQTDNKKKLTGYMLLLDKNNQISHVTNFGKDVIKNQFWAIGKNNKLFLYDGTNHKIYSQYYNPVSHPLFQQLKEKNVPLRSVMVDKSQNIWITTWGPDLLRYSTINQRLYSYSLVNFIQSVEKGKTLTGSVNTILEDDNGTVWLGTTNAGLLQYNPLQDNFNYLLYQQGNSTGIEYDYQINCLFQDKEQNIWIGTDKGISIFNPYSQYLSVIKHDQYNSRSLPKNEINAMIELPGGDLLIGTWGGGISVYDKKFRFKKTISFTDTIQKNEIWSMVQNDDGTIWVGCQKGFIHIIDTGKFSVRTIHPSEMKNATIRSMIKDSRGNIWMGLHNGRIIKWEKETKKFVPFNDRLQSDITELSPVTNMFIDKSKNFWVSTWNGFRQFDVDKRIFNAVYKSDKKNSSAISSSYCLGIEEYNDSMLLVGTKDGGLNFFNKKTKVFLQFAPAELSSNTVYAIKKDNTGYIWVTTDYGINKFTSAGKKIIPFSIEPGIVNSSFASSNFCTLQDGQWLTFTHTETVSFSPYKTGYKAGAGPKTEITGFKVFDNLMFIDSLLLHDQPVRLSYKNNFLTVEFAVLSFSVDQQTSYYYRLHGIDKDWVNGGTKRFASYTNLPPGNYVFDVKAEQNNNFGKINSFKIIITPPWWNTWWFFFSIALSIILLSSLLLRWRIKNIKTIAEEKLKVQQLNAEQYKSRLEMEQIINYFSTSLNDKNKVDDVLWDVARNLIGKLGFVDCMIYLWNSDKTKMVQKAGYGPKGSIEEISKQHFDVAAGQGVVGYVMHSKEPVVIQNTSKDNRYRPDEMIRLSEITVPVIYNNDLIGIIDSEHNEENFFTSRHLQILNTIAALMADKIKSIEYAQSLQQSHVAMHRMSEQLSKAKLEALQSQMNPHFIFNCINSIDALIQSNDKYQATVYLNKFAKLIRNILDSSKQDTVPLTRDIETLRLYIELEQFRNENKFVATINASNSLTQDDYKIPPLIIQPFVENAILHGLRNKEGNDGVLTIDIKKVNEMIQYTITDNGIGREAAEKIMQNKDSHYGMQMSFDRIKLFNNEETASVEITDLYNGNIATGTRVKVDLIII